MIILRLPIIFICLVLFSSQLQAQNVHPEVIRAQLDLTQGCALNADNNIQCWGDGATTPPTGEFVEIGVSETFACARKASGAISCWGPQAKQTSEQLKVLRSNSGAACGITINGDITCWKGLDPVFDYPASGNFADLVVNNSGGCALTAQGELSCWGTTGFSQLPITHKRYIQLATGAVTCGLTEGGKAECWDASSGDAPIGLYQRLYSTTSHVCGDRIDGSTLCWNKTDTNVLASGDYQSFARYGDSRCEMKNDGTLRCSGDNRQQRTTPPDNFIGRELSNSINVSVDVKGTGVVGTFDGEFDCDSQCQQQWVDRKSVLLQARGRNFTRWQGACEGTQPFCRIRADADVNVVAEFGPVESRDTLPENASLIASSDCFIDTAGFAQCDGQYVSEHKAFAISGNRFNGCIIKEDRKLDCWDSADRKEDIPFNEAIAKVEINASTRCALSTGGDITCWGDEILALRQSPDATFVDFDLGDQFVCGITDAQQMLCWGNNGDGQTDAPDGNYIGVGVTDTQACGAKLEGGVVCWGDVSPSFETPSTDMFLSLSGEEDRICGVTETEQLFCWGDSYRDAVQQSVSVLDVKGPCVVAESAVSKGLGYCVNDHSREEVVITEGLGDVGVMRLHIAGSGKVRVTGRNDCMAHEKRCDYQVEDGEQVTLTAVAAGDNAFVGWRGACQGNSSECQITARDIRQVTAQFEIPDVDNFAPKPRVALGDNHGCALSADGTAFCFGDNTKNQLEAPASPFVQVYAAADYSCGLDQVGSVACWGEVAANIENNQPAVPFKQLQLGRQRICGIAEDGNAHCWGDENFRMDGNFIEVGFSDVHVCALGSDYQVSCNDNPSLLNDKSHYMFLVGDDEQLFGVSGELVLPLQGSRDGVPRPGLFDMSIRDGRVCGLYPGQGIQCAYSGSDPVSIAQAMQIAGNVESGCAISENYRLSCWGDAENWLEQPVAVGPWDVQKTVAVRVTGPGTVTANDGQFSCQDSCEWHLSAGSPLLLSARGDGLVGWGDDCSGTNDSCRVSVNDNALVSVTFEPAADLSQRSLKLVGIGDFGGCAVAANGQLNCWRNNAEPAPFTPAGQFTQVDAAQDRFCGLRTDGTVVCWFAQQRRSINYPVDGRWDDIYVGSMIRCAKRDSGRVACWGSGYNLSAPLVPFQQLAVGDDFACGLEYSGTVQCWGDSNQVTENVPDASFVQIMASNNSACARPEEGDWQCWGAYVETDFLNQHDWLIVERYDEVGFPTWCGITTDYESYCQPDLIPPIKDAVAIDVTSNQGFCVVNREGALFCSGQVANNIVVRNGDSTQSQIDVEVTTGGTVNIDGEGSCANDCSLLIPKKAVFDLTAQPEPGYRFTGWEGDCRGTSSHCEISGQPYHQIKALFSATSLTAAPQYQHLSLNAAGGCGITRQGAVYCWAKDSAVNQALEAPAGSHLSIAISDQFGCTITQQQGVSCWGDSTLNVVANVPDLTNVVQLTTGNTHACARLTSGRGICWGNNRFNQASLDVSNTISMVANENTSCALQQRGSVVCGGENNTFSLAEAEIDLINAVDIRVSDAGVCARLTDGRMQCASREVNAPASVNNFSDFDISGYNVCGITALGFGKCSQNYGEYTLDNSLQQIDVVSNRVCVLSDQGRVECWQDGESLGSPLPDGMLLGRNPQSVTVELTLQGEGTIFDKNGDLLCDSDCSLSGTSTQTLILNADAVNFAYWSGDCVSKESRCAIRLSGDKNITAHFLAESPFETTNGFESFDNNSSSGCYISETGHLNCFTLTEGVPPLNYPSTQRFTHIATGPEYCGIRYDKTLHCWSESVADVPTGYYSEIDVGNGFACAIRDDGKLLCWGSSFLAYAAPAGAGPYHSLSIGQSRACVLDGSGRAQCWGENTDFFPAPDTQFVQLSLSSHRDYFSVCGVTASGEVECWGSINENDIPRDNVKQVSVHRWGGCAVMDDASLQCWGNNSYGLLDAPDGEFRAVKVDDRGACALSNDGELICWGDGFDYLSGGFSSVYQDYFPVWLVLNAPLSGDIGVDPLAAVCGDDCRLEIARGDTVTLVAMPDDGFVASEWTGDCSGLNPLRECVLHMDGSKNVSALFAQINSRNQQPAGGMLMLIMAWQALQDAKEE
ncbi:InlB B-repeat-containing protein [Idiomarina ramblicola]|uniref:Bacterial repeat domain-containing protein n=1 Tax=Idiomarina ramblicola TaxID=263724 RepID=A0A432Z1L9_9GAMM|nr:hypothetical protein [Idiomarina ramblicola]RUO71767.1 hypothetical protein CWI78_04425 [Idiomarina ramblicola]